MANWQPTDPFLLLKAEVERAVVTINQVFAQWENAIRTGDHDEAAWAAGEVKSGVKNIEWDLKDLEQSIEVVRNDKKRFSHVTQAELDERNKFVYDTRNQIFQNLVTPISQAEAKGNATRHTRNQLGIEGRTNDKYASLEREIQADHGRFVSGHQAMQQEMYEDQEKGLVEVSKAVDVIHRMGDELSDELSRQNAELEEYDSEMGKTGARVGKAIRRVDDLLTKVDSKAGYWIIAALLVVLLILFVLLFWF